jgi:ChrR Cupin-like domain
MASAPPMTSSVPGRSTVKADRISAMPKPPLEFFPAASVPWTPAAGQPGAFERILARDEQSGMLTRMLRWEPGVDTSHAGRVVHDYVEEVLVVAGSMRDLSLDETFSAGDYACRPPGMAHGPWLTEEGCEMFEVRYRL